MTYRDANVSNSVREDEPSPVGTSRNSSPVLGVSRGGSHDQGLVTGSQRTDASTTDLEICNIIKQRFTSFSKGINYP